jgi:RNA polymerase sigma-70 factor (sigma-E family)
VEGAETEYAPFEAFVREHARSLFGTALLLCGDAGTAEDLVQDALAKSFERWDVVAGARSPVAYVRRMLVHRFIDTRRGPRGRVMLFGEIPDTAIDVDLGDAAAAKHAVQQLLAVLDERPRAALVLKYLYDWPDDQIAVAIGCRKATVRSLTRRALLTLRDIALADSETTS